MPPKGTAASRGKVKSAAAAKIAREVEQRETFDVASIPMDDSNHSAAGSSSPRTQFPEKKKGSKRTRVEDPADAASVLTPQPTLGETADSSMAESALGALLDGAAAASTADTVLTVYANESKNKALCIVLNVVAKASGVNDVELDGDALAEGVEVRPLLEELYVRVPEDSVTYYMVNKDGRFRRFRRSFPDFCVALMQQAFTMDVLLDDLFLPILSQWMIAMSESKSRSFRHTATTALLGFVHGLTVVAAGLQSQLSLVRAKKDATAIQDKMDKCVEWRDHIFSQALHQRLRDVAPEIRLSVYQYLRKWMLEFSDEFLSNKYLRYLGMPLHDKKPELRAEALDTILQALARVPDAYTRMNLFLQYFLKRLVEMSNDVDVRCAELAIRVVAMMVRGDSDVAEGSELLSNEMIDHVLLALFDERPTIRAAAGVLLKVFIHCRTAGEEDDAEQISLATDLLCSFASTLRSQYKERMPEKYLVDALWTPEKPPLLLTSFAPILKAAQSDSELEAVVGLHLIAALLARLQNKLSLGLTPKDDRRQVHKKPSSEASEAAQVMHRQLSEEAGRFLAKVLKNHRHEEQVLEGVAAVISEMDLSAAFAGQRSKAASELFEEMKRGTLLSACLTPSTRWLLSDAWAAATAPSHPSHSDALSHLQDLTSSVVDQLAKALARQDSPSSKCSASSSASPARGEVGRSAVYARLHLVSGLQSLHSEWVRIAKACESCAALAGQRAPSGERDNGDSAALLIGVAVNTIIWSIKDSMERSPNGQVPVDEAGAIGDKIRAVLRWCFLAEESLANGRQSAGSQIARLSSVGGHGASLEYEGYPAADIFVSLGDMMALPFASPTVQEQETTVRIFIQLFAECGEAVRRAMEDVKLTAAQYHLQQQVESAENGSNTHIAIVQARRLCNHAEAVQVRLVSSLTRLVTLQKVPPALVPSILACWTQTPSKTVADLFKSLFHAQRVGPLHIGDAGFSLERDVVLAAYGHCVEVGATPMSVEELTQTGAKLASLHFMGTDRFAECCSLMVQFGVEFASSTDPLILSAITPYVSKLSQSEAYRLLRDQVSAKEVFVSNTNPYARSFVSQMRKTAKVQAPVAGGEGTPLKRGRELMTTMPEAGEEDGLLAAITRGARGGAAGQRISMANRFVSADGWHISADDAQSNASADVEYIDVAQSQGTGAPALSSSSRRRSVVNLPSMEEMAQGPVVAEEEVFVDTNDL